MEVGAVWETIDALVRPLPRERVALADALGRTLAEEVVADADSPSFDRVTVDGYAVRADDRSEWFTVVDTIWPGATRSSTLEPGQALRIFTGAPLPPTGLRVVMQEDVRREGERLFIPLTAASVGVCARGEDFRAGDRLVRAGVTLDPVAVATLASVGAVTPWVRRAPRVLHFTSGDEIVPASEVPEPGVVRNTNAPLIDALTRMFPRAGFRQDHLPDEESAAGKIIEDANPGAFDLLLFSGGASVGERDFTARFLERLGFEIHVSGVNVRPGKPLIFATRGEQVAFGLPGNPVSHFVGFQLFVSRALAILCGRPPAAMGDAELADGIPGRPHPRVTFWPATSGFRSARRVVTPVPWNSSGHLAALLGVDALIRLESNAALPKPGEIVQTWSCCRA